MSKISYQDINDNELLSRYRHTQNSQWLGVLLQRYTLLLFGLCMKYLKDENDAKDSVQQIFLKVIQEVGKYKIDYFKSWLYMVAKNHCLTLLRDKKGKMPIPLIDVTDVDSEEVPFRDIKNVTIDEGVLQSALKELNKEQFDCVTLFYLEKKSYQQISEITNYTLLKVKSSIQNGKRNLRLIIERKLKEKDISNAG